MTLITINNRPTIVSAVQWLVKNKWCQRPGHTRRPTGTGRCWQRWQAVGSLIIWLIKRLLITNLNNASATGRHWFLLSDDDDWRGRRWEAELTQKAVKGLAQNQPGRGKPRNIAQCFLLSNLIPLEINAPKGFRHKSHGYLSILEVLEWLYI